MEHQSQYFMPPVPTNHVFVPNGSQIYCYNEPFIEMRPMLMPMMQCAYPVYFEPNPVAWVTHSSPYTMLPYPVYVETPPLPPPSQQVRCQESAPVQTPIDGNRNDACNGDCPACNESEFREIETVINDNPEHPYMHFLKDLEYSVESQIECACKFCYQATISSHEASTSLDYSFTMCSSDCSSASWMDMIDWTENTLPAANDITATEDDNGPELKDPEPLSDQQLITTSTPMHHVKFATAVDLQQIVLWPQVTEILLHNTSSYSCSDDSQSFLCSRRHNKQRKSHRCNGCNRTFQRYNKLVRHGLNCNYKLFITKAVY